MESVAQLAVSGGILIGITSIGITGILGVLVVLVKVVDHLGGMDGAED